MARFNTAKFISGAATFAVASTSGNLYSIVVTETAAGTITVADANGTIAVLKANIAEGTYIFDCAFTGSLTVTTAAAGKLTVNWSA